MKKSRTIQRHPRTATRLLFALALLLQCWGLAPAQGLPEPRREQLLNGLRMFLVGRQGSPEVLLKLRVHSGAAFDLADREGMMALLSDALFDAQAREFVREDLGGRLEVSTDYDAIDVTLAAQAADFERLMELLRNALVNMQLTPEAVSKLREARARAVGESKPTPALAADRAAAARLFGAYPYGRLVDGSPASLARIERADLMLARERFLNPNNATLVVVGGVERARALRALKQYFGAWRKSDRAVPATFRQPEAPDPRTLIVDWPGGAAGAEVRLAVRGLARSDRDAAGAEILAVIVRERWLKAAPELKDAALVVRHDARAQSGLFSVGASLSAAAAATRALESARAVLRALATTAPTADEVARARGASIAAVNQKLNSTDGLADVWLDEHTYRTNAGSGPGLAQAINALTPEEVQRVAARLFLNTPAATVAVGDAARLRADLASGAGGVEVLGDAKPPEPAQAAPRPEPQKTSIQLKRP